MRTNKKVIVTFVGTKETYDSVDRELKTKTLREFGVDE